jgi:Lrp/AsnC family leucine-responsive transcriptional regulator
VASRNEKLLDQTGLKIIQALQADGRITFAELGRQVGLTTPAVAERVRKLEEAGLIAGYHAEVPPAQVGQGILAFIRLTTVSERYPRVLALAKRRPEFLECHHVSGTESFIFKVVTTSVGHLETIIGELSPFGGTATSIVLSSPIAWRAVQPNDPAGEP